MLNTLYTAAHTS